MYKVPFDVTIILPDSLTSGYLQSEFINTGSTYTSNSYSKDPTLDQNKNSLVFKFEVRDKATRSLQTMNRIKVLYLSNDPEFDGASTVSITNFPSTLFDSTKNYSYAFNHLFFFDRTLNQGTEGSPTPNGNGTFTVTNWPLSASGGLSTVYLKAILEGPNGEDIEYPQGYGIFDQIIWEGEVPVNPVNPEITTAKPGYVGKNSLLTFVNGNQTSSQVESSGVSRYLLSLYEISNTGGTFDAFSAIGSTKRTLIPSASIASTTLNTYRYYDGNFSSASLSLGTAIGLTDQSYGKGAFFYSKTKLQPSTNKTDYYTQAGFLFTTSGVAVTSQAYLKLYSAPAYEASNNEIVCRLDIPGDGYPTAKLYKTVDGVDSAAVQSTALPNNVLPLLKSGGLMEMYYSSVGSTNYCFVEAFFTPYIDQNTLSSKSYLLASSLMSSFGNSSVGSAFGMQISNSVSYEYTASVRLDELFIAQGKSKLSVDIGDCEVSNIDVLTYPVVDIPHTWSDYENEDFLYLTDGNDGLSFSKTTTSSYIQLSKIDSSSTYDVDGCYEVQLYKPSFSNKCRLETSFIHGCDDFYIAFSTVSSYRSHLENNLTVNWDRPFGVRCIEDFAYQDAPLDASTILVKFSGDRGEIVVLQRGADNKLYKHVARSYQPSSAKVKFSFEITDQLPSGINGRNKNKSANGTWLVIKELTGSNINLVGVVNMILPTAYNSSGLGYFAAVGFYESSYNSQPNKLYTLKYYGIPNLNKEKYDNDATIRTFSLSSEGLTNSEQYLGQTLLSGLTDFRGFNYKTLDTLPPTTITAALATTTSLPNSPAYSSNRITASTASTLSIDGVTLTSSDYLLVKDQSAPIQNGVYYLSRVGNGSTSWQLSRVPEFDSSSEVLYNSVVKVSSGSENKDTRWYLTTPDPITLGSTGITFSNVQNLPVFLDAASTGQNYVLSTLSSATIDTVGLSTLATGSKILLKDQFEFLENGIYVKSNSGWAITDSSALLPYKVIGGDVNINSYWQKSKIPFNGVIQERFISTTYFYNMTVNSISSFIASIKPSLFEFKVVWEEFDTKFPIEDIKVRFFGSNAVQGNDNPAVPDWNNPYTDWLSVSYKPYIAGFSVAPDNHLVQVVIPEHEWNSFVSPTSSYDDTLWVAIQLPFKASLAEAYGKNYSNKDFIVNKEFSGYRVANELWHKFHARYESKTQNLSNLNNQAYRVRAVSHGNISSHSTKLSSNYSVDIVPPQNNGEEPNIVIAEESNLRSLQISIEATDTQSGILSFRVGREIDNSFIIYTPWLPWDKYIVEDANKYFIYLHGHLNYYNLGPSFAAFQKQNIGFSGARKIWVQVMDYMGNISESNPLTFVASSQALVDTQAPIGSVAFYNPKTNAMSDFTNLETSWLKLDAYDLVTGIKDFKTRRLLDSGAGDWSEWTPFSSYAKVDFTDEKDGVKKVEIKFRDFGNNTTQPEVKWNSIKRPKV